MRKTALGLVITFIVSSLDMVMIMIGAAHFLIIILLDVFSAKFNYRVVLYVDEGRVSHKLLVIISFSL